MANYVKSTNFLIKDDLPTGNPDKIIRGSEIDVELNAIVDAIRTKADLNSPVFTGTPFAPTANLGTNSTQIATTAFVNATAASALPFGSIIIWAGNTYDIPEGWYLCDGQNGTPDLRDRFIVGAGSSYIRGSTGGSKDAVVVSHTHTYSGTTSSIGNHTHFVQGDGDGATNTGLKGTTGGGTLGGKESDSAGAHTHTFSGTTELTGVSGTNANLPPYYALAYIMKGTGSQIGSGGTGAVFNNYIGLSFVDTLPLSGEYEGQIVLLSTDSLLYTWDGSTWVVPAFDGDGGTTVAGIPIVTTLPTTGVNGELVFNTTDNKLYIWENTAWSVVVGTTDIDPTSIVGVVATLPTSAPDGQVVYNTGDNKLYERINGVWTEVVIVTDTALEVADASITLPKFAAGLRPIEVVDALPTTGNVAGRVVFLTTDNKLYRYNGTSFIASVATSDLTGTIAAGQIADSAVTSSTIAANAVTATAIASNAVTSAKIDTGAVTSTKLAAGAVNTAALGTGAVTSDKVAANAIIAGKIDIGAVGSDQIVANAITSTKIAASAVTSDKIASNAVTTGKIAAGVVGTTQLADAAVTSAKIATGAVGTTQIATSAVGTTQIADSAVTSAKIASTVFSSIPYTAPGTGGVARTVASKLSDIVNTADYSTLAQALTAASRAPLINSTSGKIWLRQTANPVFDEASGALGRTLAFDNQGTTVVIPASDNYNYIGIRNGGANNVHTIGASSLVAGYAFYLESSASSSSSSNLYGAIGVVENAGPGTVKAVYGRAVQKPGSTGVAIGGLFAVNTTSGGGFAGGIQMTFDTSTNGGKADNYIWMTSNTASVAVSDYGILGDAKLSINNAFIQYAAVGSGAFLNLQNAGQTRNIFRVESNGCATFNNGVASTKMIDLQNGGQINFTGTSASATAGGTTVPATCSQFITIQVNGSPYKIAVYAP